MPFDGIEHLENRTLAELGRVEQLLASEQKWCKGRLRDIGGRHCLVGAIAAAEAGQDLARHVMRAVREVSGKRWWRIESFNDDPGTTHEDVLRVLHRTRENIVADLICAEERQSRLRHWLQQVQSLSLLRQRRRPQSLIAASAGQAMQPTEAAPRRGDNQTSASATILERIDA